MRCDFDPDSDFDPDATPTQAHALDAFFIRVIRVIRGFILSSFFCLFFVFFVCFVVKKRPGDRIPGRQT